MIIFIALLVAAFLLSGAAVIFGARKGAQQDRVTEEAWRKAEGM